MMFQMMSSLSLDDIYIIYILLITLLIVIRLSRYDEVFGANLARALIVQHSLGPMVLTLTDAMDIQ